MDFRFTPSRIFLTLWFWSGVILSTAFTGVFFLLFMTLQLVYIALYPSSSFIDLHDLITSLIENVMASIIFEWMVIPRFWKVEAYWPEDVDENEVKKGKYILASNHTSIIDTLFIALFPIRKTYTYNQKWARVPVFGWLCVLAGYIGISAENKSTVVERVSKRMSEGYSVMIYPEGTRSKNPNVLQPLKTGAFRIASRANTQILPITFQGTSTAVDRYGMVDYAHVKILFGKPFSVDSNEGAIERGMKKFQKCMEEGMESLKNDC